MSATLTDRETAEAIGERLRSIASPARLMILAFLAAGERSVGEIEQGLGLKQPGLSQQLADLRQSGWVATRRQAKSIFYRLANTNVARLVLSLPNLLSEDEAGVADLVSALTAPDRAQHPKASAPVAAAVFARAARRNPARDA